MLQRKILLIRHGQSTFNAVHVDTGIDPMLFDAPLTDEGHAQAAAAGRSLRDVPVEVVVTSPLTRAMQTSLGIFGGHPARPRLVVEATHRERLESSCDQGRTPAELQAEFPQLDFAHLAETWWHDEGEPDPRGIHIEPVEVLVARMQDFAAALRDRTERVIAVVGHGTFFYHLTGHWLKNCEIVDWDGRVWDGEGSGAQGAGSSRAGPS